MASVLSNLVCQGLTEALGYFGAEMDNDNYPSYQDNSGHQSISGDHYGRPVVSQSNTDDSTFAKYDTLPGNKSQGDLVRDFIQSKNPGFQKEYGSSQLMTGRNGETVLKKY